MSPTKKANLLIIFIIAILAFGTSTMIASITGSYVNSTFLNLTKDTDKLAIVGDSDFSPVHINKVIIINNTTDTNNTTIFDNINDSLDNNLFNSDSSI